MCSFCSGSIFRQRKIYELLCHILIVPILHSSTVTSALAASLDGKQSRRGAEERTVSVHSYHTCVHLLAGIISSVSLLCRFYLDKSCLSQNNKWDSNRVNVAANVKRLDKKAQSFHSKGYQKHVVLRWWHHFQSMRMKIYHNMCLVTKL